jgi:hypothetical protein
MSEEELDTGIAAVASSKPVVGDQEKVTPSPTYVPVKVAGTPVHVEASPYEEVSTLTSTVAEELVCGHEPDALIV